MFCFRSSYHTRMFFLQRSSVFIPISSPSSILLDWIITKCMLDFQSNRLFSRTFQRDDQTRFFRSKRLLPSQQLHAVILKKHLETSKILKMAKILDGKQVSNEIKAELKKEIISLSLKPVLAIIQVGGREDSNVYIRMKSNFAEAVGVESRHIQLPNTTTQQELEAQVEKLNNDPTIHGIIVQLPLDSIESINSHYIINKISPYKDVDGLTIVNAGNLLHGRVDNEDCFVPCTPYGCMKLIEKTGIDLKGKRAVVVGRSKIVGSPMAQLLNWANATVTLCHQYTENLSEITKTADVLVVAIGQPLYIKKDWIKPGAIVIDVGITSIEDSTKKSGWRLAGDVDYDEAKNVASYITPVPGGVGPMTVAILISNTVKSAKRFERLKTKISSNIADVLNGH